MNKLALKIGTGLATGVLIASGFAPAIFADTTATIEGNGEGSSNTITITNTCVATVLQKNKTNVSVSGTVSSSTGGNEANSNTGSGVTISTGDATSTVEVTIGGSTNTASLPNCCECVNGPVDATISGNGIGSANTIDEINTIVPTVKQKNRTRVRVRGTVKAKTGKNKANNNTGGTVDVTTGAANSSATVTVDPSSNSTP